MRQQRITTSQQEIYLIYISEHQDFGSSKIQNDAKDEFEEHWKELTKLLNATLGPKKTLDEWKTVFMHWKTQLKTRAKKLKTVQESTQEGNETKLALQKLTDIEKRALKLWKEDFQDIASILNEIENKDITITPIRKKRKSTSDTITHQIQLPQFIHHTPIKASTSSPLVVTTSSASTPTHIQVPITITAKQKDEIQELINIKLEPFEEVPSNNTLELKNSKDIQAQDILDWAKNYNVSDPAIDALFNVLRVKRIKHEVKHDPSTVKAELPRDSHTLGMFAKVFARLDRMESHLIQRISTLERKLEVRTLHPVRVHNPNPLAHANSSANANK